MAEILHHAFFDSINMLPFLFAAYLVIEYIEKHSSDRMQNMISGFGRFGPLGGAVLGCIPQCGFSASAANLYANRVITLGTLVAVFLSTSDEAIPLLLLNPEHSGVVIKLVFVKLIIASVAGFVADILFKSTPDITKSELHQKHEHCCDESNGAWGMIAAAIKHTVFTYMFILVISVVMEFAIHGLGEEKLALLFMTDTIFQPFVAALVGFIPNCASSVFLTQLYIDGTLSFGSVVAGLCTGAGVGIAVLFKENRSVKDNVKIMGITYLVAVIAGLIL